MKDKLIGFMLLPLFAGAAMAAEPQTVVSIENEGSYLVDSGSYISASGYYYIKTLRAISTAAPCTM